MKKIILLLCLFANMASAQVHTTVFCTQIDSANYGGGWFCNQDSLKLNFYDHSTGNIVLWTWTFHGAIDSVFQYTSFVPMVSAKWDTAGYYRVTLATLDSNGQTITLDVGVVLSVAQMHLNHDTVFLPIGDSVNIIASGNGGPVVGYNATSQPNFIWYYNGTFLQIGQTDSIFIATDTGSYVVYYTNGFYCGVYDTVVVVRPAVMTIFDNREKEENFSLYPNPADEFITVMSPEKADILEIYSMVGDRVFSTKIYMMQKIDISLFKSGIYICKVGGTIRKFVIFH